MDPTGSASLPPGGGGPDEAATAAGGKTKTGLDFAAGRGDAPDPPPHAPGLEAAAAPFMPISYTISKVREYLGGEQWDELEVYLKKFVTCKKSQVDTATTHAALFLHCRRGQAMQILAESGEEAAYAFYNSEIVKFGKSSSDFVVPEELQKDVDAIGTGIQNRQLAQPEDLDTKIDDYMRLYFPQIVGHVKKVSELWQFAVKVDDEGTLTSNNKKRKPSFRCLACQRVFKNHTITIMKDHFEGGNCTVCPKKTTDIVARLDKITGETKRKQTPKNGKGTKEKSKTQEDPMLTSDLDKAQKAYDHVLVATRQSNMPNIKRDVLQQNLDKAGDFLESLIKSLKASKESTTGHQSSIQLTDRGNVLQTDVNRQQRADPYQLRIDAEIGFSPQQGAAAHQLLLDRELAFTPEKWASPGQLHFYSFENGSAFQQLGPSTYAPERHVLDPSDWWNDGHYDNTEQVQRDSEDKWPMILHFLGLDTNLEGPP